MRSWSSEQGNYDMKTTRCYESHPPLPLSGELKIYGGSCVHPIVHDADVYVGFDYSMKKSPLSYPWENGESFLYQIQDMGTPMDFPSYERLVEWLSVQLIAQKKVHIGCIGGHGRTGLVLATLVKLMMGEVDAISYVRKNYCHKAVESETQINFLVKRYGIRKVAATKDGFGGSVHPHSHGIPRKDSAIKVPDPVVERKVTMAVPSRYSVESAKGQTSKSRGKVKSIWGLNSPFRSTGDGC